MQQTRSARGLALAPDPTFVCHRKQSQSPHGRMTRYSEAPQPGLLLEPPCAEKSGVIYNASAISLYGYL